MFEGVEGSGKTTQLAYLKSWLQNSDLYRQLQQQDYISDIKTTCEPGGTEFCKQIRQLLLQPSASEPIHSRTELLLYAADRAQHVEQLLRPALQNRALVLCDRYTDSTTAYQGYGRGIDLAIIDQINQLATDGLVSDLTLWLDIDAELGLKRAKGRGLSDRMEQASLEFHRRVQQGFAALATQHSTRIVRIDAGRPEADVSAQVQQVVAQHLIQWYGLRPTAIE